MILLPRALNKAKHCLKEILINVLLGHVIQTLRTHTGHIHRGTMYDGPMYHNLLTLGS